MADTWLWRPEIAAETKYDYADRMTQAVVAGITTTFTYNGDGLRVGKSAAGGAGNSPMVWDVGLALPLLISDSTYIYIYGNGPIGMVDAQGNAYYYLRDGLGSVTGIADSSGTLTATYSYDAYGNLRSSTGSISNSFRYTGEWYDSETGLYYLRARYYDPTVGRFVTRDPWKGTLNRPYSQNPYLYGYNNPVKYVDPTGHAAEDLQYLEPNWFDEQWKQEFWDNNHRDPTAVDYVYRFVTMGLEDGSGYTGENIMRDVTIAIGAGLEERGPSLWSDANYQAGMQQSRAQKQPADRCSMEDQMYFGENSKSYQWGAIRLVTDARGMTGGLAWLLGGDGNAVTFSANLIVFTTKMNFNRPEDMWHLLHELEHVRQAQQLGVDYLPTYVSLWRGIHSMHPMERDANSFANRSGTGVYRID